MSRTPVLLLNNRALSGHAERIIRDHIVAVLRVPSVRGDDYRRDHRNLLGVMPTSSRNRRVQ